MSEANNNSLTEQQAKRLLGSGAVTYTVSGRLPHTAVWDYTADDLKEIIAKQSAAWIKDIKFVTIQGDPKNGVLYAYIWIPKDSPNLCDKSLNQADYAIRRSIIRYSNELKEYMDKFGNRNHMRTIRDDEKSEYVGIEVQIDKFMEIEMDRNCFQFGREFGNEFKKKLEYEMVPDYSKGADGKFGKLNYLRVTKRLKTKKVSEAPVAVKAFNSF